MPSARPPYPDASAIDAARRVLSQATRVADPVKTAQIFPAEAYVGADFWRFERWALFEREWLCIGHVGQIPNPGDYYGITLLDEPLVVVRDLTGEIRVLSAICQHRGHPLLDGLAARAEPMACRHGKVLVCPYHAWSYRLDGSFQGAPEMRATQSMAELQARIRLPAIRHTVVAGLIFVTFDEGAPDPAARLAKMLAMIEGYGLAELVPTPPEATPIKSNWKIYQENSLEPYHTDYVHRTSHNPAPAALSEFYDYAPGDGAIITTTGFAAASELFASEDQPALPQIPGLSAEQQSRLLFVAVLPMLFLLLEPGSVLVTIPVPEGPETMLLLTFSLYPRAATQAPGYADAVAAQKAGLRVIVGEDVLTQEALQRGHRSRFTPPGTLSWLEATIPQMNGWLLERYRAALEAVTAPGAGTAATR